MKEPKEHLSFFEALTGLIFEPRLTTETLFDEESPPHAFSMVLLLFIFIFTPIVAQAVKYGYTPEDVKAILGLLAIIVVTLLVFIVIQSWLFLILRIDGGPGALFAAISYSVGPLSFAVLLIYLANYLASGSLSVLNLLSRGGSGPSQAFMNALPWALGISQAMVFVVFFYSIKAIGKVHSLTAFAVTTIAIVTFCISLSAGIFLGDAIKPGLAQTITRIFINPGAIDNGRFGR